MKKGTYLEEVKNQYENYPYPPRDPEDEKGVLFSSKSSSLDAINYFCFNGERDFSKPFRVLVPGGGTGDCTTYLAEQLRDTPAEIVYLDMTKASMEMAKARAEVRGLTNITWIHDSILNLPEMDIGLFDYITCTGVLHHLSDPQAGLDALKSVLHPEGSIFLMLYGQYGRTGIYQMQELLRRIHVNEEDLQKKVNNTKSILKTLPTGNWFNFNANDWASELQTDIGIYDLLLHPQDRAYTVPELYDYVEKSGLKLNKLFNSDHILADMLFQPETFIRDPAILQSVKQQSFREQAAICELMFGQLMKQCCYISHKEKPVPSVEDLTLIPSIALPATRTEKYKALNEIFTGPEMVLQLNPFIRLNRTAHVADLFKAIDGKRSAKEVIEYAHKRSTKGASIEQVESEYKSIASILIKLHQLYLRQPGLKPYIGIPEMENRMHKLHGKKECMKALDAFYTRNNLQRPSK